MSQVGKDFPTVLVTLGFDKRDFRDGEDRVVGFNGVDGRQV